MKKFPMKNNNTLMKMINQAKKMSKINHKKNLRWSLTKIIKVRVTIITQLL
jgi:hypothetical protein